MDSASKRLKSAIPRPSSEIATSTEIPIPILASVIVDDEEIPLVKICGTGDLILDVTFQNTRTAARLPAPQPGHPKPASLIRGVKTPDTRVWYRVKLESLTKNSKYFHMLLLNASFEEGLRIRETLDNSKAQGIELNRAHALDLPRVTIRDEDDATYIAGREHVFSDLLRILQGEGSLMRWTLTYSSVMAVMADLYDCTPIISRYVKSSKKMSWPSLQGTVTPLVEEQMRQKVLVSWFLDDQVKFASATKELILRGSAQWTSTTHSSHKKATWWNLPDDLEVELQYRRSCINSVIWSLLKHFITVYSSKERQCKYFYESSSSCDSFSLGEIVKFLLGKNLLSFVSPLGIDEDFPAMYSGDIDVLIQILRQCPSYQIDSNHRHCGMRSRIIPPLDYIQSMLTSSIGIDRRGWKTDRSSTSWEHKDNEDVFCFTKRVSNDPRIKVDGLLVGSKHAQALFTASDWDWNPEEPGERYDPNAKLGRAFGSMSGI